MMESRVTRKCHARFGERDRETRTSQGVKVRSVPTPLSPLLANIALHGMEEQIKQYAETLADRKVAKRQSLSLIRYGDDFVILHKDLTVVQRCREIISFNGEADHVHVLFQYHPDIALSNLVNNLKSVTSRKLRQEFVDYLASIYWKDVFWNGSYFVASCGGVTISTPRKYIENQGRRES